MNIQFNRIYIIESLQPDDARLTGTELHNDLLKWKTFNNPEFESVLCTPKTKAELLQLFDDILKGCTEEGISPILHFEIHGSDDQMGLVLTSKELVTWEELSHKIRPINHILKNGLFITMGVCHGCYFMSKDIVDKPSLFQGIIASFDLLHPNDIYVQFYAFYEELFTSFDLNKAYVRLLAENPAANEINYACYSSEYIFAMVQTNYDETQCSREGFERRALDEIEKGNFPYVSRQDKRNKIRQFIKLGLQTKEKYFKEAYNRYFMLDDYPELAANISFPPSISAMKKWFRQL